jgi:hypothetical protein
MSAGGLGEVDASLSAPNEVGPKVAKVLGKSVDLRLAPRECSAASFRSDVLARTLLRLTNDMDKCSSI